MSFPLFSKKFKHDQPYRLNFYLEIFLKIKPYKIVKKEILFFFLGGGRGSIFPPLVTWTIPRDS